MYLFVLIGGGTLVGGCWQGWQALRSASWPTADGEVLSSSVASHRSSSQGRSSTTYGAEVHYRYEVDGVRYENDDLRIGQVFTAFRSQAQKAARRHPRGPAKIYYDPSDPQNSVLEPGFHLGNCLMPGVGLLFTVVGVILVVDDRRRRRPPR